MVEIFIDNNWKIALKETILELLVLLFLCFFEPNGNVSVLNMENNNIQTHFEHSSGSRDD